MATIRQRKLKNGLLVFDIQVKATDKNTGQQVTKTTTWRQQEGMSEKKAQKEREKEKKQKITQTAKYRQPRAEIKDTGTGKAG